ncbi:hypothetical protein C8B47_20745, partial [filamentous cyanobacterium CCP4]
PPTAPPESLSLNQGPPRLSPQRSAAATPPAALTVPEAAVSEALEAQPSATQTPEAGASDAQILEAQTPGSAFSVHQGQGQPGSLSPSPQPAANPKDLPAAYCLHTSGLQASGLSLDPETQTGADPAGSEQLSTLVRAGSADAALARGEGLNKAEPTAACLEENEAAAEPAAAEPAAAEPAAGELNPALPLN